MSFKRHVATTVLFASASLFASAASAASYVGSWAVDSGPFWSTVPAAYTGQEAAALLFGGVASDYVISTIDNNEANIDNLAWVSTWGGACGGALPCGTKVAEGFKISTGGLYASVGDTSAFVRDWALGPQFTNYAFRVTPGVPEPATWGLMLVGLGVVGSQLRRRKVAVSFA